MNIRLMFSERESPIIRMLEGNEKKNGQEMSLNSELDVILYSIPWKWKRNFLLGIQFFKIMLWTAAEVGDLEGICKWFPWPQEG